MPITRVVTPKNLEFLNVRQKRKAKINFLFFATGADSKPIDLKMRVENRNNHMFLFAFDRVFLDHRRVECDF